MFVVRPRLPRWRRGLCPIALLVAASLFAWPGQGAWASTIGGAFRLTDTNSGSDPLPWYLTEANDNSSRSDSPAKPNLSSTSSRSWYLTNSNSSNFNFQNGSNFAKVTVSVDDSDKVTFDVNLLSKATSNNYVIDKFAFNWAGDRDILKRVQAALADSNGPMNNWKIRGANGDPKVDVTGMGKFNYQVDARSENSRSDALSLTVDLSGLGLTKEQIISHFQVLSNGSDGGGFFALHFSTKEDDDLCENCFNDSFFVSGSEPAPSYASNWGTNPPPPTSPTTNYASPTLSGSNTNTNTNNGLTGVGGGGYNPLSSNIFGAGNSGAGDLGGGGGSSSTPSSGPNSGPPGPTPPGPTPPWPTPPDVVTPEPSSLLLMGFVVGLLLPVVFWRCRLRD
ncbi:MAG: hypothetical protein ACYC3I_14440 [Gemmataceae bacterium]